MRLDVGVLRAEEVFGQIDGSSLDGVDVLTPGVEPVVGVALGVLVGEEVAHGELDGEGGVVLRGDHLEAVRLVVQFCDDGGRDLGRDGADVFERCEAGDESGVQVAAGGGRLGNVVGEGRCGGHGRCRGHPYQKIVYRRLSRGVNGGAT